MEGVVMVLMGGVAIWLLAWPCHRYLRRELPKEGFIAVLLLFALGLLMGIVDPINADTCLFYSAFFWPVAAGAVKGWRAVHS